MGRGNAQTVEAPLELRATTPRDRDGSALRNLVERLDLRVSRARRELSEGDLAVRDPERYRAALARALGVIPAYEQRTLVRAARDYEGPRQPFVRERASELLLLTNYGLITDFVRLYNARGLEEQVLRAEAESAVPVAIARFDFDKGANFVTYLLERMRHSVGSAVRKDGRLVRLKSEMGELAEKVLRAQALLVRDGQAPTANAIAELTSSTPERVAEALRLLEMSFVSIDAPLGEDGQSFADVIADPVPSFAAEVSEESQNEAVHQALASLPASQRFLLERLIGLDGNGGCEQKDFVRGVYVDNDGNRFTSERSVDRDLPGAIKRERPVLLRLLEAGELRYEPLNEETEQLYTLLRAEGGSSAPPSIDQVEALFKQAKRSLRESEELRSLRDGLRYRGTDAIKHSAEARALVRREIELRVSRDGAVEVPGIGLVDEARARTLEGPSERNDVDRSELTRAAEFFGLVDSETRALTGPLSPEALDAAASPEYEQPQPSVLLSRSPEVPGRRPPRVHRTSHGGRVSLTDLLGAQLLRNEKLVARHKGKLFEAQVEPGGSVTLTDGRSFPSLSAAAEAVCSRPEGGWTFWQVERGGKLVPMAVLREQLLAA